MDNHGYLGVIPTFGSGTLLVRSRTMMESSVGMYVLGENMGPAAPKALSSKWAQPPPTSPTSGLVPPTSQAPQNPTSPPSRSIHTTPVAARDFPAYASKAVGLHGSDPDGHGMSEEDGSMSFNTIGSTLYPLFCVSVHEHAWMSAGYGVWGKEEYLKRFWTVLDWKKVSEMHKKFSSSGRR